MDRFAKHSQCFKSGLNHVVRVCRAQRLGQNVRHTCTFQHGAHRAPGDHTRTMSGRLDQHLRSAFLGNIKAAFDKNPKATPAEIEEALSSHAAVAEVAVVGVADPLKGQVALAFVVLRDPDRYAKAEARGKLEADLAGTVDRQLGAIARPARVHVVSMLPKTRSGKLLRRAIAALAEGRDPGDLPTIEDPAALAQLRATLDQAGGG